MLIFREIYLGQAMNVKQIVGFFEIAFPKKTVFEPLNSGSVCSDAKSVTLNPRIDGKIM